MPAPDSPRTPCTAEQVYGGQFDALEQAARCADIAKNCDVLTAAGACTKPNSNLIGAAGVCRRSCGDCIDCLHGDIICERGNLKGRVYARAARRS